MRTKRFARRRPLIGAAWSLLVGMVGVGIAMLGTSGAAGAAEPRKPAEPDAAPPPADVVDYLRQISGDHTVTGQHNREPNSQPALWTSRVHDITGVYPGLWGGDFLFSADDVANRQTMIDQAATEWNNGSLVTLTWHVCPPTRGQTCGWDPGTGIQDDLSDAQWRDLVTEGGTLYQAWRNRLDEAIPYLRQLNAAGVPVLFRPLHEMNDGWSWWGGRPGPNGSRLLYQQTHDYLTDAGLDNLIWVWNVKDLDLAAIPAYYPGDDYVDVVSLDVWMNGFPPQAYYDRLRAIADGKPIALGEVGHLPSPAELASQPEWTYFMVWAEYLTENNTEAAIKATYGDPRSLNQGELTG